MKVLYFYLFYNDDIREIIQVSNDEVSRVLLYESHKSNVSDTKTHNISNGQTENALNKDVCEPNLSCGDCRSTNDVKGTSRKFSECISTTVKVFKIRNTITMDLYQLSYFHYLLGQSFCYRHSTIENFGKDIKLRNHAPLLKVKIKLLISSPSYHVLDYLWCQRLERLCYERQELETAMAWLSTLGGAFSALGDKQEQCAVIAGKISVQQLRNAMRLGDPLTVARCKLYFSLSLIQQRKFRPAKHIIKEQYQLAIANAEKDFKLVRMCLGIWSKLKYEKKHKKSKIS
nr:PREDICTED: uncharacterized protein LOC109038640 [Bemisia tabaci]